MTALPDDAEPEYTSLADKAYTVIRDRLIMLDIPPMTAIDDVALAKSLEVGRTPVREALKRLEIDRLVVSYPRRGTFATGVDITDLAYISEIRVQLEPLAARRAAEYAGPTTRADLAELADTIDRIDVRTLDRDALMRWDLHVHRTIYEAAANPHLEDTLIRYDNLATRIFCLFLDRMTHFDQHVGEHSGLLRAIAGQQADEAADRARAHVIGFEKAVREVV
ncbi:Transcriptional regulator, GntR family [Pseudonocardia sp. Ae406_Ps2]|uniref:GntR family transcriptional regulator n=1 Tax=unclassified Pseudonocardia TaxID=2619320 RepID=UPI000304F90E|nr:MULTISPECIES: FCD domain-containing protein [unclassified Pseudonocardia]OLL99730.1 Transcriptional regulator, GntR family [Pseudonocardia sp. Ae331_Ps2]OLM02520.1 Transcriptional regulator, GntR family [Pseudonocardia sp. Ae406_Ps2]OLM12642.1 Transcriptional regulator, GntR family [Pseudonocardia sp. Ae505_Ps2]OLM24091.1 Transcriptional regulator, GntR family [Pseudonocardia sp. Ae706_Ps2]